MRDHSSSFVGTYSSVLSQSYIHWKRGVENSVCEVGKKEGIIELLQVKNESQPELIMKLRDLFGGVAILSMETGCKARLYLIKARTNGEIEQKNFSF